MRPCGHRYTEKPNDYIVTRLRCPGLVRPTCVAILQQLVSGPTVGELQATALEQGDAATKIQSRYPLVF